MKRVSEDLVGRRFGNLTVTSRAGDRPKGSVRWNCKCTCGRQTVTRTVKLTHGITTQCQSCNRRGNTDRRLAPGEYGFNNHYRSLQRGAEKRGIKFSLTRDQVKAINKQNCYYCGLPPSQIYHGTRSKTVTPAGRVHAAYTYTGVDRVNNDLGYEPNNVRPCCKMCNWMKSNLSYDAFIAHITRILELHKQH